MIPNTTQVPNYILRVLMKDLTETELKVLLYIVTCTLGWIEDIVTKRRKETDWISYGQLKLVTGKQSAAISNALKGLELKELIEVFDKNGYLLKTIDERRGKKLHYRLRTTSSESEEVNKPITSKLFGFRTSESEDTKEIHTKDINTKSINRKNPEVEQILKEFTEETDLSQPADKKPREWAYLFAKHKGVNHFKPCLEFLVRERELNITKLETVFRQYPLYERDVLKEKKLNTPEPFKGFT